MKTAPKETLKVCPIEKAWAWPKPSAQTTLRLINKIRCIKVPPGMISNDPTPHTIVFNVSQQDIR